MDIGVLINGIIGLATHVLPFALIVFVLLVLKISLKHEKHAVLIKAYGITIDIKPVKLESEEALKTKS